jgi:hypothetical protein
MAQDASPLLLRQRTLLAKAETTTGTAVALAGTDGVFIAYCDDNPIEEIFNMEQRPKMGSGHQHPAVPGAQMNRITFEIELAGNGASGLPAWASTFLPACNFVLATATYTQTIPVDPLNTLTIGLWENGRIRKLSGAMGDLTITGRAGHVCRVRFVFTGKPEADEDDVANPNPTFPTVLPPRFANASAVTLGSFSPKISSFEIRAGNDVQMREDATQSCGYRSALIPDALPTCSLDPEAVQTDDRDIRTLINASTEEALSIVIGSTANDTITIAAAAAQMMERKTGARNKMITDPIELQLNQLMSIAFS